MIVSIFGAEVGVGVGFTTTFLTTGFFTATGLDDGFLTAGKDVAGNRRENKRAKTMYFFMVSFSRFLLSYPNDTKGRILSFSDSKPFGLAPKVP